MRARSIKPSLFKNELLGAADPLYTVVFEGLWCLADREGRLEDRPLRIHVEVNPYRDSASTVQALDWLVTHGFLLRYTVGADKFIAIVNFTKHQQPHIKEAASKIPAPSNQGVVEAPDKPGANTSVAALTPDSGLLTADCGLLTACNARSEPDVSRESSADLGDFILANYPNTDHRKSFGKAVGYARLLISTGRVSEADLRRRLLGYGAFVRGGGVSGPAKVCSPQTWFEPHIEDPYWAKDWAAPPTKAQVQQDANINAGNEWLRQSGNA